MSLARPLLFLSRLSPRGRLIGDDRAGVMGIIVQNATYTITAPIYLILYVFTSPIAPPTANPQAILAVDP